MNPHRIKKNTKYILGSIVILLFLLLTFRFFFAGNEDLWICSDNKWITHGNPSYPKPSNPCGKKAPLPKTKEACLEVGGVWKKIGPDPVESCNIKATDRGTVCTDSGECEGLCQAEMTSEQLREGMKGKIRKGRGICSVWRVEVGCFGMVEEGVIKTICVD